MYSSKAMAKHKAVLWPIIMDGQPYSWIDSPGTNLMFRILDPQYTLHTASFYRDLIGKVGLVKKSRIRETPTLSTDADSRTDTNLKRLSDLSHFFFF